MFFPFEQSNQNFVSYPSKISSHRQSDYIIEPWQKDNTEMDIRFNAQRAYKTFYEVSVSKTSGNAKDRNFLMQKTFSNRKDWENRGNRPQNTTRQISRDRVRRLKITDKMRTGSVSQYNFNNPSLGQIPEPCQRRFSNQFYLKRLKWNKDKNRDKSGSHTREREIEIEASPIRMNLQSIKKRVTMNRQAERTASKQVIRINSENEEQMSIHFHLPVHALRERRKNKVIALGYQKISVLKGITKQRSLNLTHRTPLL